MNRTVIAIALAAAAAVAPATAQADGSPDAYDRNHPYQNLSNPDTRDAAAGQETSLPTQVYEVRTQPTSTPSSDSFHWEDVAIGAGGMLGIGLLALGGTTLVVRRRQPISQ
jgi:hypothetical protein